MDRSTVDLLNQPELERGQSRRERSSLGVEPLDERHGGVACTEGRSRAARQRHPARRHVQKRLPSRKELLAGCGLPALCCDAATG